jgi:hypothetical protein
VSVNFVGLINHENMVGETLLKSFSGLSNTEVAVLTNANLGELIKEKLQDDNFFIFNSRFINELEEVDINYTEKVCSELNNIFRVIKGLIHNLHKADKRAKFLFITTNPGISHLVSFPVSPIYDEAIHSLVHSLAKEFRPSQFAFHGICIEPISEMLDKDELRNYRRKMKVHGMQKNPIRLDALTSFIKNLAFTDFRLASGNIFYIAEGMDQVNL